MGSCHCRQWGLVIVVEHSARIVAFVDSNPNIQGQSFRGIPVISPKDISGRGETILIASWAFADEIEHQIRVEHGYKNPIIRLGGNQGS